MSKRIPLWITLLTTIPVVAMWWIFLSNQIRVSKKHGVGLPETLLLHEPQTREAIAEHLPRAVNPAFLASGYFSPLIWILAATILAVTLFIALRSAASRFSTDGSMLCLAVLPLLAGLFQFPVAVVRGADAMAQAGIGHPGIFGMGLAEALALPIWGFGISLVLGIVFWRVLRRKAPPAPEARAG